MNMPSDLQILLNRQAQAKMRNLTCIDCKYNKICKYANWLRSIWDKEANNKIPLLEQGCTLDPYEKRLVEIQYEQAQYEEKLIDLEKEKQALEQRIIDLMNTQANKK